jgi:hypothetical protein
MYIERAAPFIGAMKRSFRYFHGFQFIDKEFGNTVDVSIFGDLEHIYFIFYVLNQITHIDGVFAFLGKEHIDGIILLIMGIGGSVIVVGIVGLHVLDEFSQCFVLINK